MTKQVAIGIDVGGTKIAGAIVDTKGQILSSLRIETPQGTANDVVAALKQTINNLFEVVPETSEVIGIGLAVAGTVNWKEGTVVQSPNLPFSNFKLREIIDSELGLTTFMDNDANLAALAEKYYGVAQSAQDFVGLTLGTGIGSGIFCNGCLYRGATGAAAELGHMVIEATGPQDSCGSYGCLEIMASGRTLVHLAKEKVETNRKSLVLELAQGDPKNITGPLITKAAHQGDKLALDVFNEIGFWLGIGINNIVNIFNPELVVIGGGMAEAGELILAPARKAVSKRALHPNKDIARIVQSDLGNKAGVIGAAALVFDELFV